MVFQVGDKVIHATFGLSEITGIEEKLIQGHPTNCYVVRTTELTIWIPINDQEQHSLRAPTPPDEFERLSAILTHPSESLQEDRLMRKSQLLEQMKDGQLTSICRVVRDLSHYKKIKKLNDQESSILERAVNSLLTEWTYSLHIPLSQAHQDLYSLLGD